MTAIHQAHEGGLSSRRRWWIWCADPLVIATVLVALAAATNFGRGTASLDERTRMFILISLLVGVFTLVGLATTSVVSAAADPREWSESVTVLAITWLCLLVSHVVLGEVSRAERSRTARAQWKAMKIRAAGYGIRRVDRPSREEWIQAEVAFWAGPFAAWIAVSAVIAAWTGLFASNSPVFVVLVVLYYPTVLAGIGWRATADLSGSRAARYAGRGGMVLVNVAIVGVLAVVMSAWLALMPLAVAFVGFNALYLLALFVVPQFRQIRVLREIEVAATATSLTRAHARSKAAKAERRQARNKH